MEGLESASFADNYEEVLRQLKILYGKQILEVEKRYKFGEFHSQPLRGSDFDAKPMILLMGQYSVGKTSFIQWLLKRNFPGMRIGPEPTTDRFVAIMHGNEDQTIYGNALSVDAAQPFHGLNQFGSNFLNKFEGSLCDASILKNLTLIDTPGILSGEKQRLGRSYSFTHVFEWFAERADLILILFDAHKLDISDEFREAIELLKGNDEKVRIVLNKADSVSVQQLMRVYGALNWSLGKVINTPEVPRVYIGSYWDHPYQIDDMAKLFDAEMADLLHDLLELPRNSAIRKSNELVKRVRLVRTHAYLISHLREKMPVLFGKDSTKADLIKHLEREYQEISRVSKIPLGDFPPVEKMQKLLKDHDFSSFEKRSDRLLAQLDHVISIDLPRLMKMVAPKASKQETNPFAQVPWVVTTEMKKTYDDIFYTLDPKNGRVSAEGARNILMNTGIPVPALRKIWELVDFTKSGRLDSEEFAVALLLTEIVKKGKPVPNALPENFIPISKRLKARAQPNRQ